MPQVNGLQVAIEIRRHFLFGNWINKLHHIRKYQYNARLEWHCIAKHATGAYTYEFINRLWNWESRSVWHGKWRYKLSF